MKECWKMNNRKERKRKNIKRNTKKIVTKSIVFTLSFVTILSCALMFGGNGINNSSDSNNTTDPQLHKEETVIANRKVKITNEDSNESDDNNNSNNVDDIDKNKITNLSISKNDIGTCLDPIAKDYIKKNINKDYSNFDKIEVKNILTVKNTIVDSSKLNGYDTIDSFFSTHDTDDAFITNLPTGVALYNTDDNSKYYVAYADTMRESSNSEAIDATFAKSNNNGETIYDAYFDKNTGLAYIPKSYYKSVNKETGKTEEMIGALQMQIMQSCKDVITPKQNVNYLMLNGENNINKKDEESILKSVKNSTIGNGDVNTFSFQTVVQTEKGLNKDDLSVYINGLPISSDQFNYIKEDGRILLAVASCGIQNITVDINSTLNKSTYENKNEDNEGKNSKSSAVLSKLAKNFTDEVLKNQTVNALTNSGSMDFAGSLELPSNFGAGKSGDSTLYVGYLRDGNYNVPVYTYPNDEQGFTNTIYYGYGLNYGKLSKATTVMKLGVWLTGGLDTTTGKTHPTFYNYTTDYASNFHQSSFGGGWLALQCAHINNPQGSGKNWGDDNVRWRCFEKGSDYVVIGFTMKAINTQTGHGVAKFKIRNANNTLTAHANGGTLSGENFGGKTDNASVTVTIGSSNYYILGTAYRTGYTFDGFYTSPSGGTKVYYSNGLCVPGTSYWNSNNQWQYAGNLDIYAHWIPNTYTVTYDANGGTGYMPDDTATYDSNYYTKSNKFERTGYSFVGWNEKADGSGTDWTNWIGVPWKWTYTKNITLYAQWKVNTYTDSIHHYALGFDHGEGDSKNNNSALFIKNTDEKHDYGTTFKLSKTNACTIPNGYKITDIYGTSSIDGNWHTYKFGTSITQREYSMNFEFYYVPIDYKITYNLNGGINNSSNPNTYDVLYGFDFKNPTRTGYIFQGWYDSNGNRIYGINRGKNAKFSSVDNFYKEVANRSTGNITVEARWIPIKYNIIYDLNDTSNDCKGVLGDNAPTSMSYNSWATVDPPTRDGFIFTGWTITGMDDIVTHYYGDKTTTKTTIDSTKATKYKNLTSINNANITFKANWKLNVDVSIDVNDENYHTFEEVYDRDIRESLKAVIKDKTSGKVITDKFFNGKTVDNIKRIELLNEEEVDETSINESLINGNALNTSKERHFKAKYELIINDCGVEKDTCKQNINIIEDIIPTEDKKPDTIPGNPTPPNPGPDPDPGDGGSENSGQNVSSSIRYISKKHLNTLDKNSKWLKNSDLYNLLTSSLNKEANDNNAIYVIEISKDESDEIKKYISDKKTWNNNLNKDIIIKFSNIFKKKK